MKIDQEVEIKPDLISELEVVMNPNCFDCSRLAACLDELGDVVKGLECVAEQYPLSDAKLKHLRWLTDYDGGACRSLALRRIAFNDEAITVLRLLPILKRMIPILRIKLKKQKAFLQPLPVFIKLMTDGYLLESVLEKHVMSFYEN